MTHRDDPLGIGWTGTFDTETDKMDKMDISRGMEFITTFPDVRMIATCNPDKDGRFVAIESDGTHHILYVNDVRVVTGRAWPEE